jgi:predicted GNAT family N-acyltransferase
MGLYTRFGFEKVGEMFDEVGIDHYEMQKKVQG